MLTEPSVDFTVPLAEIARDQTGNFMSASVRDVAAPASMTNPRPPLALSDVASRIAEHAVGIVAVTATTSTSPGRTCSIATCSIQLSPRLGQHGYRIAGNGRTRPDWPHVRLQEADAAHGLMHRCHPMATEAGNQSAAAREYCAPRPVSCQQLQSFREQTLIGLAISHGLTRVPSALNAAIEGDAMIVLPEMLLAARI
jgi:hypothetical protein